MKKYLIAILAVLLLIIGCDSQNVVSKGEIAVNIGSRSIDPISMETEYYEVTVTSGNNFQKAPHVDGESTVRFNVDAGTWKVSVDAYNAHGDLIGSGEEEVKVSNGSVVNCTIKVDEISGTGTFSFSCSIPNELGVDLSSRTFKAIIYPVNGTEEQAKTVFEESISWRYSTQISLDNGFYVFELYEKCSDSYKLIYLDEVRIIADCATTIYGTLNIAYSAGDSSFEKKAASETQLGKVKICIENTNIPLDTPIVAEVVGDVIDENVLDVKWYVNDELFREGKTLSDKLYYDYEVGDIVKLSVIVRKSNVDGSFYYEDYCYLTISEPLGFPEYMDISKQGSDKHESLEYLYTDKDFEVVCFGTTEMKDVQLSGDWYIDGVLVSSGVNSLKLEDLTPYLGAHELEFVYRIGDYSISAQERFVVLPKIVSVSFDSSTAFAGRKWDASLSIKTSPENALDDCQIGIILSDSSSDHCYYPDPNGMYGYLPEAKTYDVKLSLQYTSPWYGVTCSTDEKLKIEEADDKDLLVFPGTTITRDINDNCYAYFSIPYEVAYESVVKWYLDGEEIVSKSFWGPDSGNNSSWGYDSIEWSVGEHDVEAIVDGKDVYKTTITIVESDVSFDLNWKKKDDGMLLVQIVPSSDDYSGNYSSSLIVSGYSYSMKGSDWVEVDPRNWNPISIDYDVTYEVDEVKYFYQGEENIEENDLNFFVSFDKYVYTPNDFIVIDINTNASQEEFKFLLDGKKIDINFTGNGEYLLPKVKDVGDHSLSVITTRDGYEEVCFSRKFIVSETGFNPNTPKEVYQRLAINGTEISYSSLFIYEGSYATYGISATSKEILMVDAGSCVISNNEYTLNSVLSGSSTILTKRGSELANKDIKYEMISNPECASDGFYGSWKFTEIRPDSKILEGLLASFIPSGESLGLPFESLVSLKENEGFGLNLQFEIDEDWITAYIDLDVDVTALDEQISLAPGLKLHLEGKAEYDIYDGCLSIVGNGVPVYIQPTEDDSVLIIHIMIHTGDGEFMSFAVPLRRTDAITNPIDVEEKTFDSSNKMTLDSVFNFITSTADLVSMKIPVDSETTVDIKGTSIIASMFAGNPVKIAEVGEEKEEFVIPQGKWKVSGVTLEEVKVLAQKVAAAYGKEVNLTEIEAEYGPMLESNSYKDILSIFGDTLYVMMNQLEFISKSSYLVQDSYVDEDGVVSIYFEENHDISRVTFTPMYKMEENTIYVKVEHKKFSQPTKVGVLKFTLEKDATTDISVVYDFAKEFVELGLDTKNESVFAEFDEFGNVWFKAGNDSYEVASYSLSEDSIILKTDLDTILDLMPSVDIPFDGIGMEIGLVLPFDSSSNMIVLFEGKEEGSKAGIELVQLQ